MQRGWNPPRDRKSGSGNSLSYSVARPISIQWGGSPPLIWANRYAGMSPSFNGRRQPSRGGTSRINREVYVRFCERLGVKIPGPDRQNRERRDTSMARLLIPRQRTNRCSAAHASRRPGVPPLQVVAGGRNSLAFGCAHNCAVDFKPTNRRPQPALTVVQVGRSRDGATVALKEDWHAAPD